MSHSFYCQIANTTTYLILPNSSYCNIAYTAINLILRHMLYHFILYRQYRYMLTNSINWFSTFLSKTLSLSIPWKVKLNKRDRKGQNIVPCIFHPYVASLIASSLRSFTHLGEYLMVGHTGSLVSNQSFIFYPSRVSE